MKVLFIGGNRFFGVHAVNALIEKGYDVTIANRGITTDLFGSKVKRIKFDRNSEESIKENLNAHFDVILDNLNYSPNDTKRLLDNVKTDKYIYTSSTAVYFGGLHLKEEDFNQFNFSIKYGDRKDFQYKEGKRYAEAVAFQKYSLPITAVRFPVVIGNDDYTNRLRFYAENIKNEEPINITNFDKRISFIDSKQAGEFLAFLSNKNYSGAINAASEGTFTFEEIIHIIENITNKKAVLNVDGQSAPYNEYGNCVVNTDKAKALGFEFRQLDSYFCDIINRYIL